MPGRCASCRRPLKPDEAPGPHLELTLKELDAYTGIVRERYRCRDCGSSLERYSIVDAAGARPVTAVQER